MLKRIVKEVAAFPFRIVPPRLRRRLVQVILHATASRDPRPAMRGLLEIDTDVQAVLEQVGVRYDGGVHVKHRLTRYHDFFVDRVRAGERVLDIGCGYGAVAHSVATRTGAEVVGLDSSPDNLEKARCLFPGPRLTFVEGTAPETLPPGRFDVILMSNVLEHIDDRVSFLRDVQRRLSPKRWLVRVPMSDRHWQVSMRRELGLFDFSDPTHFIEYTRDSFEREMSQAGFTVTHLQINWGEIWAEAHA